MQNADFFVKCIRVLDLVFVTTAAHFSFALFLLSENWLLNQVVCSIID